MCFYDTFYRAEHKQRTGHDLDAHGKLVIYSSNGLELCGGATDPVETVAALTRVTEALLALPYLSAAERNYFEKVRNELPPLPTATNGEIVILSPAKKWEAQYNKWELPELYAAWPYRLVCVLRPKTRPLAHDTWDLLPDDRSGLCKQDMSWMPTLVDIATLGWPDEAQRRAIEKLSDKKAQVPFPAFFGSGLDWLPDHNWGGSGMVGLQEMRLAADSVRQREHSAVSGVAGRLER